MGKSEAKCCNSVIPYNAARPFKKPAALLAKPKVRELLSRKNGKKILELGAGGLRNALYLQKLGFNVVVVEVKGIRDRFPEQYENFEKNGGKVHYVFPKRIKLDLALATFVIETICKIEERTKLLKEIFNSLRAEGALLVSVRGPADLVTATVAGVKCSDGYITPNYTFARSYTRGQLGSFLRVCGFKGIDFLHKKGVKQPEYLHAIAWKEQQ